MRSTESAIVRTHSAAVMELRYDGQAMEGLRSVGPHQLRDSTVWRAFKPTKANPDGQEMNG